MLSDEKERVVALLSELVKAVADAEGLEEVSVGVIARAARESGLISQKGRGRGAAHMNTRDAANLLIAVNGCSLAKNVAKDVPALRSFQLDWTDADSQLRRSRALRALIASGKDLGEQLEHLIELARPQGRRPSELNRLLGTSYKKADADYASQRKIDFPAPCIEVE